MPLQPTRVVRSALQPLRRTLDRAIDWALVDRRFDADTGGRIELQDLGLSEENRIYYVPSPALSLRQALKRLDVGPDDVFVDFGSGKGRMLLLAAADYPFRRVIGVELSEELNAVARRNVERNRPRLRCQDVELITSDAAEWEVPDDVTVAYFYYPFFGPPFRAVLANLVASLDRRPRRFHLVYNCPKDAETVLATRRFRETARFRLRYLRIFEAFPAEVPSDTGTLQRT